MDYKVYKKRLVIFLLINSFLVSCQLNDKNEEKKFANGELPDMPQFLAAEYNQKLDFEKSFNGKINNRENVIANVKSDNKGKLEGEVIVKSTGAKIPVKGNFNALGELNAEMDINGIKHKVTVDMMSDVVQGEIIDINTGRTDIITLSDEVIKIPEVNPYWEYDPGTTDKGFTRIIWQKKIFDPLINDSIIGLTVNTEYISHCDEQLRSILGLMSYFAGADDILSMSDDTNSNNSDVNDLLLEALGFENHNSVELKRLLDHWFKKDKFIQKKLESGYYTAYGAEWFIHYDYLNLKQVADTVFVEFEMTEYNNKKGHPDLTKVKAVGDFKLYSDNIKLIDYKLDTLVYIYENKR
jgi:hypothetical protein